MRQTYHSTFILLVCVMAALFVAGCSKNDRYSTTVNVIQDASGDLDLQAVGEVLKSVKTAEEFETKLNSDSPRLNNLDLDEDGKVDYISVSEYGSGNMRGFSLTTQLQSGETQEIATIEIEKEGDEVRTEVQGNQHIYGRNHYYHSRTSLADVLLISWLFSNRPAYRSGWGYGGNYPPNYRSYPPVEPSRYREQTAPYRNTSTYARTSSSRMTNTVASPNQGKNATQIKAPLKNPTTTQKSFQQRNPSKRVASGGFGRPGSSSRSSSYPSVRSSSSSRSGSSFGGGK